MKRFAALLLILTLVFSCFGLGNVLSEEASPEITISENSEAEEAEEAEEEVVISENLLPFEPLEYGSQGVTVTEIQQKLTDLGYYTGKISGNYLEGTRAGIKGFQEDYGLEVTGVTDEETYNALMAAEFRPLKNGDNGVAVTRLQEKLIALGYLSTKATGKFRSATEAAVKEFQSTNGLEATGEADAATQKVLFSDSVLPKGGVPTPTPDPDTDFGDLNDVVMTGDGEDLETTAYEKKLSRGSKGDAVKQVQTRLKELGFFDGPISGNYMNKTVAAVKLFQEYNGMTVDGITDENTWNAMFNTTQVVDASCTPRPTPEPTPIPYAITVDVRNQAVIVYGLDDEGNHTKVVKRFICSTGMKATPSDVGEWVLTGAKARWCYFPKWGSNAQYWTRINSSIAFHSVIYNSRGDSMVMSTKSYNKLGQRASHGCIRLLVSDAKWIYDNIGEGTVVTITESLPNDEELRKAVAKPAMNSSKSGPVKTPEPTAEPNYTSDGMPPQPFETLKKGSKSEGVYWLQMKLTELGYYTGSVTGGYYSGTESAVKKFQKDHGLRATGTADVATQEALFADVIAANATPEPTAEPTATPEPTPTVEVTASPTPTPAAN